MKKLGITGGIGSGKSIVTSLLKTMGIPVYIADDEAKKITASSPEIREQLISHFGDSLFENDVLNKSLLASLIFDNKENLKLVNSIIHPKVGEDFSVWATNYKDEPLVAMEAAILFESGFDKYMDLILTVTAPLEVRIQRVMQRDKVLRESVLQRINSQFPDEMKCELSDFIVYNSDEQAIIPQIEKMMKNVYF